MTNIDKTLKERNSQYGDWREQFRIAQNIKVVMKDSPNCETLDPASKEILEMMATKFSRILNGDPTYFDNWHDGVGYMKLKADDLEGT